MTPEAEGANRSEAAPGALGRPARTALLFALLFLAALVLVVGRAARDGLFLTRFPVTWIAPMWVAYAMTSAVAAVGYARLADRLPRVGFAVTCAAIGFVTYGVLRVLIGLEVAWAYPVFYVWSEIVANLLAVVGWTIAQDLNDARSAKRAFAWVGAGRVVGMTASGFLASLLARVIGALDLILVLMGALVAFGAIVIVIGRGAHLPQPRAGEGALEARLRRMPVVRSRYVQTIALATLVLFAILTIGDYQFKAIARSHLADRDALAGFMGLFYGLVGGTAVVIQLLVTPRLLERRGVLSGLLVMPSAFAVTSLGLFFAPGLLLAALMKGSDNGLQFTIHEASLQMLFFPYPEEQRDRMRAVLAGAVKPLGYGIGGVALMLLAPGADALPGPDLVQQVAKLSIVTVPLALAVMAILPRVRRGYVDAMRRSLMRHDRTAAAPDGPLPRSALEGLREALRSDDGVRAEFAATELRELDPPSVLAAIPTLMEHQASRVRALALELASAMRHPALPEFARARLADVDPNVRLRAVELLATSRHEDVLGQLEALCVQEADPDVRQAATAALIRHCGLDGMLVGAPKLSQMLSSDRPSERAAGARVIGLSGMGRFVRSLAPLLDDPSVEVRRAAVGACVRVRPLRLVAKLIHALDERALRREAEAALAALGAEAVPCLERTLGDPMVGQESRIAVTRVLGRIDHADAFFALVRRSGDDDEIVRGKIAATASRVRKALDLARLPVERVRGAIERELALSEQIVSDYLSVRPLVARPLLEGHVIDRVRRAVLRALRFCELAFPRNSIASVRNNVFDEDAARRANAYELLDATVRRPMRERIVAAVEAYLRLVAGRFAEPDLGPREAYATTFLADEIATGIAYRAGLALESATDHLIYDVGPYALEALDHAHPFVRENAVLCAMAVRPLGCERRVQSLLDDPDPIVVATARSAGQHVGQAPMLTTVEKVLFLQRVPVFSRVPGEDLVDLARGAQVVDLTRGEVVFERGAMGAALYFIVSGLVCLDVSGSEIATLGPNEVFGEMSIFDREPRGVTARAGEETRVLRVAADDFQDAVRASPELAVGVIRVLNERLRKSDSLLAAARAELDGEVPPSVAELPPVSERLAPA